MRPLAGILSLALFANVALAAAPDVVRDFDRGRHVILQPAAPLTQEDREELAAKGVVIQRVTAGGKYIARVADDTVADARIVALESFDVNAKIHSSAFREAARGRVWANVNIYFHDDVTFESARTAILASGGALDDVLATAFAPMRYVSAKIPAHSLTSLAADDRVLMISGPRRMRIQPHNATSAAISHVSELFTQPFGLTGAGVAVSLFELAEGQASHVEFGGRVTQFATGGSSGDKQHATHVMGTIGAAGLRADAKGMAPAVSISQYKVTLGANGQPLYHNQKDQDLAPRGIVADNNSWGYVVGWSTSGGSWVWEDTAEFYGAYDYEYTAPIDQISRDRNILFVHSAGNEGDDGPAGTWGEHRHNDEEGNPDLTKMYCYSKDATGNDCPAPTCAAGPTCETTKHHPATPFDTFSLTGAAKNVLAVGAVDTEGNLLALSSRGPAKDGRVKPDVVARGAFVVSTVPTNSYATASGTSMASPVVTGIAALLAQQWRRTFVTSPTPAELKALIIAGASDYGNVGPDYSYGFGLVNARESIDYIVDDGGKKDHVRSVPIAQGQTYEMPIIVSAGEIVRVVLHWSDPAIFLPPDQVHTAKALVNDLDLRVSGPTGQLVLPAVFSPWVLDKANVTAPATRGVNTVDNTEVVDFSNAAPGAYRIFVTGTSVAQGPQMATIVTSARGARPCRDIQEPNNSASEAFGNLSPNSSVHGGLCAAGDVDYFKFRITEAAPTILELTAGDTPLRVSINSSLFNASADVPAYTTGTLAISTPIPIPANLLVDATLKIEALSELGVEPDYDFTLKFGQESGKKRRATRH